MWPSEHVTKWARDHIDPVTKSRKSHILLKPAQFDLQQRSLTYNSQHWGQDKTRETTRVETAFILEKGISDYYDGVYLIVNHWVNPV